MSVALLITVLAVMDGGLIGFRASAGRCGLLDKRAYYRDAIGRGMLDAFVLVAAHGLPALALAASTDDVPATLAAYVAAASPAAFAFAAFAGIALLAFVLYFSPVGDFRVLANVVVLGPFTVARPWVIAAGCGYTAFASGDASVACLAVSAAVSMIASERVFARRYASQWRALVGTGDER